jgi:hypothetical protein
VQRGGRREVDDPAPPVLDHSADKSAASKIGAEYVDGQGFDPTVRVAVFNELDWTENARGIYQDRDNSRVSFHLLFQFLHGFELADIGWNCPRCAAGSFDCLLGLAQLFCVAGNRNHLGAVCGQVERRLPSEAAPRAGDQGHFAFQLKVHLDFGFGVFLDLPAAVSK